MSTIDTAPPAPDIRRTVAIDFLFLELSACARCGGTGTSLDGALAVLDGVVQATGTRVEVRRIHVRSLEQARDLQLVSSPTIRVNGRDIAPEPLESGCGDGCGCGGGASCRLWSYAGREYTEAPVGLIVDAVLSELYGGSRPEDPAAAAYELPDNLVRVFAGDGGGCCR